MLKAQVPAVLDESSQFAGTPIHGALDLSGTTLYCGDCTEVGAPQVDGLLIGSRFGGGQSGSRTREPPPRCIFCWCAIRSRMISRSGESNRPNESKSLV